MTREELLRVLTFADSLRHLSEAQTALASVDARWNIISYAMRRHFDGKLLTITSLADAAGVPYGTAMRRITELLDEGLLMRRPRSQSGKSFSLHPTRELIRQFEEYATQFKMTVGETFGFGDSEARGADFFFGGYYMTSRHPVLSERDALGHRSGQDRPYPVSDRPDVSHAGRPVGQSERALRSELSSDDLAPGRVASGNYRQ